MVGKVRNIVVEEFVRILVEMQKVEFVERKGIGYFDSIVDGIVEVVSRVFFREYVKRYGIIFYYNIDQVEVVGGRVYLQFGGGEVIKLIYIFFFGRVVEMVDREFFFVYEIVFKVVKDYFRKVVRYFDFEYYVIIDFCIGQGSVDFVGVFNKVKKNLILFVNDIFFGVGYVLFSEIEKIVFEIEKYFNSDEFKKKYFVVGEDIKVMGFRKGDEIDFIIVVVIVDSEVDNFDDYMVVKEVIYEVVKGIVEFYIERLINIYVNIVDDLKEGIYYIIVIGISVEVGDDGFVGRGNRVNGFIIFNRYMSMEVVVGKNLVSYVGKIYNIFLMFIVNDIVEQVEGVEEVYVRIFSQIGKLIDEFFVVSVQIILKKGYLIDVFQKLVYEIVDEWLVNIMKIQKMIFEDKVNVF